MSRLRFGYPFGRNRPVLQGLTTRLGKTAVIYPASALNSVALGMVNLGVVFYLRDVFAATPTQVGLITSLYSLAYFIGCFVLRPFSRLLLPRYSLVLSTAANSVLVTGTLLAPTIGLAAMFHGLFGFSVAFFWPPIMGWLSTGLEGKDLGKALSRFNFSWSLGMILSPSVAGLLTEVHPRLPIAVGAATFAVIAVGVLIAATILDQVKDDSYRETPVPRKMPQRDTSTPLRFPAWVGVVAAYASMGVISVVFPMYAREQLLISAGAVGAILLLRAAALTGGFVLLGTFTQWHYRRSPMVIGLLGIAVCTAALSLTGSIGAHIIVIPAMGVLLALAYSQSVFHGVSGAHQRAKRMAIHESLLIGGAIVGSSAGGAIYERFGMARVYALGTLLLIGAAAVQLLLFAFGRKGSRALAPTPK